MTPEERARRVMQADPEHLEDAIRSEIEEMIEEVYLQFGSEGQCKGCGATIWWIQTRKGKLAPFSRRGYNHFIDCPQAAQFKGDQRVKQPGKRSHDNVEAGA